IYLPMLMSLGIGLSVNNSRAVLEALFNRKTAFKRTPKYKIEMKADRWTDKKYKGEKNLLPVLELLLGIYFTFNIYWAFVNRIYVSIPFLMIFQIGFLYIAFLSIFQVLWERVISTIGHFSSKRVGKDIAAA
ncbi:MAG: hypothetical protein AAB089_06410, partial [Nitrospirota bacterium]